MLAAVASFLCFGVMPLIQKAPPAHVQSRMVEGLIANINPVSSPDPNRSFAQEIAFYVQAEMSPFDVDVLCDKPITGIFSAEKRITVDDGSQHVRISYPSVTPKRPLRVTLLSKEPFNVLKMWQSFGAAGPDSVDIKPTNGD